MAKILFLEDEKTIREVLCEYIRVAGHEVTECETGEEAIETLRREHYDLGILDIRVPGKSGLEVLEYIRTDMQSSMGVIMLTAYDDIATQVEAFNFYADDYITKPASPIILLKRMDVLLHRIGEEPQLCKRGLIIDEKRYKAYYDGEDLNLTVSEFLLLKALQEGKGRVYTREQLIEQIFHEEYFGSDRIIDAHIKNLRKKIPIACITTVIGVGYRMEVK